MKLARRIILYVLLSAAFLYGIDEALARLRSRGAVDVDVFYSVTRKDNKVDFLRGDPQTETCVNSVLPHMGFRACWELTKNPRKQVDVGISRDDFWRH